MGYLIAGSPKADSRRPGLAWSEASPDLTGDGAPDLLIDWEIDGEAVRWVYTAGEEGFTPLGPAE